MAGNNIIRSCVINSAGVLSGVKTDITLSSDYLSGNTCAFIDQSHFIQTYINQDGKVVLKSFSITSDSVTLIDTFVTTFPTEIDDIWGKDAFNLVVGAPGSATVTGYVASVKLDSSYNITGTSPHQSIPSTVNRYVRYSGSGDVYNTYGALGGVYFRNSYTVNAYSTTTFTYAGIASASASSGTTSIITGGVVGGYSGLTVGVDYFVNKTFDGTLTAVAADSIGNRVGKSISATQISMGEIT